MTATAPARDLQQPKDLGLIGGLRHRLAVAELTVRDAVGPWFRVAWRYAGPVLGTVSPVGWIVLLLGLAALIAGRILGWAELTFVAATLLGALLVASAFLFGRARYEVTVGLNPRRVTVGERALGELVVVNVGTRKSTPGRMELPVGSGLAEFSLPAIEPRGRHDELFAVPTNRRAVISAGPAISVRGDQLGLLRRTVRWTEPSELFVHPATTRLDPTAAGLVKDLEGQTTKTITNNDLAFHALRPYEPGDDRRYVHWRTSARTGVLMVRQFEETRRSQLTIIQTVQNSYYENAEEFELAVSVTASLGAQVIRDGTQMSVVTDTHALRTHSVTAMLDDSCRLELVGRRYPTPRDFARETTKRLPPPSVVMIVAGSRMGPTDFRAIESLFGQDARIVAFRVELGAQPRVASVAGLQIITIGELTDLPKTLRRVI